MNHGVYTKLVFCADNFHLGFSELCSIVARPVTMSLFLNHISHIISVISKPQMIRVDTKRMITCMKNPLVVRYLSIVKSIRESVRIDSTTARPSSKRTISVSSNVSSPMPATVGCRGFLNVIQEMTCLLVASPLMAMRKRTKGVWIYLKLRTLLEKPFSAMQTSYQYAVHVGILALLLSSVTPICFANDKVSCDPTHPLVPNAVSRFEKAVDFPETPGFLVWIAPNNSMTAEKQTAMNTLRGQIDSLLAIPHRYWLCTDTTPVDGVLESVTEMTQAQKDAMDADDVAAQQRSDALQSEIQGNDYCLGELSELQTRIDTATTNWVTARQAEVDSSPNNVAGVKTLIRNQLIPGIGQALNTGFTKTMTCLKARTDRGVGQ